MLNDKCRGSINHLGIFVEFKNGNLEFYNVDCYNKHKSEACKKIKNQQSNFQQDCT